MQPADVKAQKALEMARGRLDFAALAASAPRVKDVIAHAQTIVPIAPVRPWWKPAAAVGAVALAVAAVLLPWLPVTTRLSLVQVSFEHPFSREQAQAVEAQFLRALPGDILSSGSFTAAKDGAPAVGHLVLQLSALNWAPGGLTEAASRALSNYPAAIAEAQVQPENYLSVKEYVSPFEQAKAFWLRQREPKKPLAPPSAAIARQIAENAALYRKALKRRLGMADYELTSFAFVPKTGAIPDGYDFVVPAWPLDAAVAVREYPNLLDYQKAGIRSKVEEVLAQANLLDCSLYSADDPLFQAQIQVQVVDAQLRRDCCLSRRLQAWVDQPEPGHQATRIEAEQAVEKALDAYLPQFSYQLSTDSPRCVPQMAPAQAVTVVLTGEREREPGKWRILPEDVDLDL